MGNVVTSEHAVLDDDGAGILTLTFCRREKRNAVSDIMLETLDAAVTRLGAFDASRVLVIRATGPYFTAGVDLDGGLARAMRDPSDYPGQSFRRTYRRLHRIFDEIEAVEKPVVMAVQGPCLGVGMELGASCDFRFAADSAVFGLPEVAIGVIAGSGGTSRLTRLVGPHWTKWMTVACQRLDARQALQIGYVHEVVPAEALVERVNGFAKELVGLPGEAMGMAKLAVDVCTDVDRLSQRNIERIANTSLFGSPEFIRRTAPFVDRASS